MPTKTTDTFWKRFFKGVVIALGFILPGVSGGVLFHAGNVCQCHPGG